MALNKPLEELTEADLQSLKDQGVPEDQVLDYKKGLFLKADPPKDEFRADVTAFANGVGGHLVIGMDEEKGIPTELCGMEIADQDAFTRQIDEVLQNKITPPVPGYKIRYIPVADGKTAVVIRIPQSYAKPHQITVGKDDFQFWVRNASKKTRLAVDEFRSIILQSETLAERIRSFRLERLGNIIAGDTPVKMEDGARIVLHMMPLSAFGYSARYDMMRLEEDDRLTTPLTGQEVYSAVQRKYHLDRYVSHLSPMESKESWSYFQAFRNGVLEYVDAHSLNMRGNGLQDSFWHSGHKLKIADAIRHGLELQKMLSVKPPVVILLTLIGVRDYTLLTRESTPDHLFSRDTLNIPEVVVEDFETSLDDIIRPLFDAI